MANAHAEACPTKMPKPPNSSAEFPGIPLIPKPESSEHLQRFGTAVGLKRPNLQDLRRLGLLSPTASSNSRRQDRSELSGFGITCTANAVGWPLSQDRGQRGPH